MIKNLRFSNLSLLNRPATLRYSSLYNVNQRRFSQNNTEPEPVREEYVAMMNDFDKLVDAVKPIIKNYYAECGRPHTTRTSNLVLPKTIIEELGPIPVAGDDLDSCIDAIKTTFKYSMKTLHPYFNDKLYYGSDPVG